MGAYTLRRLLQLPLVLLGISLVVFLIMALLPGDPALAILGPYATPEALATLRAELGLDQPLWSRFWHWLSAALQGDLGRSISLQRPVADEIAERLGPTLLLASSALGLSVLLGLAAGVAAAAHHGRWQDRTLTLGLLLGISTPQFWLALLLILVFAVWLQWLPVSGMYAVYAGGGAADLLRHLLLPTISLAVVVTGVLARLARGAMLEELSRDYIRMARAKGLSEAQVVYRHALRNMLGRMLPVIGLQAGFLLGGAVYVETLFQWPGLGRMLVDAFASRDLLLEQGGVLDMASDCVLVIVGADLVHERVVARI